MNHDLRGGAASQSARRMAAPFAAMLLLASVLVGTLSTSARAQTETVDTVAALLDAVADPSVDEIVLQEGDYELDEEIVIDRSLTIRGHEATSREDVVIQPSAAGDADEIRLLQVTNGDFLLRNVTLAGSPDAALWIDGNDANTNATVRDVQFTQNYRGLYAGGFGDLLIDDSLFLENASDDDWGSAVFIECSVCDDSAERIRIVNSEFVDNAAESLGGAISLVGFSFLEVADSTFTGNTAEYGGAILAFCGECEVSPESTERLQITDSAFIDNVAADFGGAITLFGFSDFEVAGSTFAGNTANGKGGGAIHAECFVCDDGAAELVQIVDSEFVDNVAADLGGAIIVSGWTFFELAGSTFTGNTAVHGSAIYFEEWIDSADDVLIENSTFASNGPGEDVLYVEEGVGSFDIVNSTIAVNEGTGIHSEAEDVVVANSIIWGNTGGDCDGPIVSVGNNIDSDGTCNLDEDGDLPEVSAADLDIGPLADNGGPTRTRAISVDSVAYEAGNLDLCTDVDQRGVERKAPCDIGAFEFVPDEPSESDEDEGEEIVGSEPAVPIVARPTYTG